MNEDENIKLKNCVATKDGVLICGIDDKDLAKLANEGISLDEIKLVRNQGVLIKSEVKPVEPIKSDVSSKPEAACRCSKTGDDEPKTTENETKPTPEGVDSSQSDSEYRSADQELTR